MITEELIREFRNWLLLGGLSGDTGLSYARSIQTFGRGKEIKEVNDKSFFLSLKSMERSLNTISRHTFAFKKFLTFLSEEKGVSIINIFSIKCKKQKHPNPNYLEREEIELIRNLPIRGGFGARNRSLFEFLLFSGCRISEALNVDFEDIQGDELIVRGKGDKERVVFLGGWKGQGTGPIFLNQYGKRWDRKHACVAIREMGRAAKIPKRVYPHMIRTTFATHMIRQGVDPRTLQEMLGHEDIETTLKHYVGVSREHMRKVHHSFAGYLA